MAKAHVIRECESRITEEHLRIRSMLDRIQSLQDPYASVASLRELREYLENHFTLEEGEEGLYSIVAEYCPQHSALVDQLLAEHWDLLASVDNLIKKCNEAIRGPMAEIKSDARILVTKIQSHDSAETEILTEALLKALPEA